VQVNDGDREGGIFVVVMITPNSKDMGALIGFGGFNDELISVIAKGKNKVRLSGPMLPVQVINVRYEEDLHWLNTIFFS